MILDLTLKDKSYLLKIHQNFFQNKSTPLNMFQSDCPLTDKYAYLGKFEIDGQSFGFGGCFKLVSTDTEYSVYCFDFSQKENETAMRLMMMTVYLATYYVVEQMYYEKEYFSEDIWYDQSLSFVIFNGGPDSCGYALGGQIYPWFKKRMLTLSESELSSLKAYIHAELRRVYACFNEDKFSYGQVTITNRSFFVQVSLSGRWLSWSLNRDLEKQEEFSSHNLDFHSDQELCFAAIIAINTWLRNH